MKKLLALFVVFSVLFCGCGEGEKKTEPSVSQKAPAPQKNILKIGRISYRSALEMAATHKKFFKYLADKAGFDDAELVLTPDYKGIIEKLEKKEIDVCWLGTAAYIEAKDKMDITAAVRPVRFGLDYYGGSIIVREDSGINSIADLKGKSIGFIDKNSASGYLYPKALLLEYNLDPDKEMQVSYLQKHDKVVYAVLYKKIDAGCVFDGAPNQMLKTEEDRKQIKILAQTDKIANEPIVISPIITKEVRQKIIDAFLSCTDAELLKPLDVEGFKPAEDKDYDYTRKVNNLLKQHGETTGE